MYMDKKKSLQNALLKTVSSDKNFLKEFINKEGFYYDLNTLNKGKYLLNRYNVNNGFTFSKEPKENVYNYAYISLAYLYDIDVLGNFLSIEDGNGLEAKSVFDYNTKLLERVCPCLIGNNYKWSPKAIHINKMCETFNKLMYYEINTGFFRCSFALYSHTILHIYMKGNTLALDIIALSFNNKPFLLNTVYYGSNNSLDSILEEFISITDYLGKSVKELYFIIDNTSSSLENKGICRARSNPDGELSLVVY